MRCLSLLVMVLMASVWSSSASGQPEAPPELKILERFVGDWTEEITNRPAEWTPEERKTSIKGSRKWSLGKRMIENRGKWDAGDNEFIHLMTFDAQEQEFRQWYFDSSGAIQRHADRGKWDETTKTFHWHGEMPDGLSTEGIVRFLDDDHFEWTMIVKDASGKKFLDMIAKATRKKPN